MRGEMATNFLEAMRRPKAIGAWSNTSEIQPGQVDYVAKAMNLLKYENDRDYKDRMWGVGESNGMSRGRGLQNIGRGMQESFNQRGMDPAQPYDVVYDQRPEMMQKQLNLQKRAMDQNQRNLETERATETLKANDEYIDNRRETEMKNRLMSQDANTREFAAKNLRPGEMSDQDKLAAQAAARHADITQQGVNRWVQQREQNQSAEEIAKLRVQAAAELAHEKNSAPMSPNEQGQTTANKFQELMIQDPELASSIIQNGRNFSVDPNADAEIRRRIAAAVYGEKNVPMVAGVGSAGLGGTPSSPGLRGNAPIDEPATATPYAGNQSSSAPIAGGGGQVRYQTNPRTGQKRMSRDGGQTWQLIK
jgi:hypothetical protein